MDAMDAKEGGSGAAGTRDKLVEQAVRFLQNPKVRAAPEQSRRDFLKSKGLSDEVKCVLALHVLHCVAGM